MFNPNLPDLGRASGGKLSKKSAVFSTNFFSSLLGNTFEHYDKALFAFLAPFIAPLFFPQASHITALILTYGIMPLGLLSKPLGALVFGRLGDLRGRKTALFYTLSGMALTTIGIGTLPTFRKGGIWAPILLALGRLLQNFFASGETTGGALLILENTEKERKSLLSSLYSASTMLGILLASCAVTILSMYHLIETYWRALYFGGAFTAIIALYIRQFAKEPLPENKKRTSISSTFQLLWQSKELFISLLFVSGFSYCTFYFVTSMFNGYLPLITSYSKSEIMQINTWILILDFSLLPLFGFLSLRFAKEKMMFFFSILAFLFSIPLLTILENSSLLTITLVRIFYVVIGVGFSAPFYAWAEEKIPKAHRYTLLSLGVAIGSQLIGEPACSLSLWLYKMTGWSCAPALYLMSAALCATLSIQRLERKEKVLKY